LGLEWWQQIWQKALSTAMAFQNWRKGNFQAMTTNMKPKNHTITVSVIIEVTTRLY